MKRFVRPGAVLLLAALLFCLSGCYSGNIDQYFSLPMASEEYRQLQSLIDEELASGSEYAAPTHGSYRQSVQLSDVDGDGADEALAFFRDAAKNPRINIYDSENGEYRLVLSLSGEGSSIGRIDYADLTGDGRKELLVSWQISAGVSVLSVYSLAGWSGNALLSTDSTEFVTGDICTYDAVINSKGEPLVESMCVCPPSIADVVNENLESTYFVEKKMSENLRFWGRRTVKAFGVTSRFVHLEFFRLNRAHRGLGEVGDFVALEVNMRPGGGYTPDMINYAHNISMFKIWADMIAFDRRTTPDPNDDYYCVFAGRRDNVAYVLDNAALIDKYRDSMMMTPRIAPALAPAMGDYAYIARFRDEGERDAFLFDVCNRAQ